MVVEHFSMVELSTAADSESAEESKVLSRLMLASNSTLMSSWSCFDWLLLLLGICLQIFNSSWYMFIMVESTPSSFSISTENFGESCSCSVDFGSVAGSGTKSIIHILLSLFTILQTHIRHYGRLAIKQAHISVPITPSKLL